MTYIHPGAANVFIPTYGGGANAGATEQMRVEFSRNPASFKLNRYVSLRTVEDRIGYFVRLNAEDAINIPSVDNFDWPDGNDAPVGNTRKHEFVPYYCRRQADSFRLGQIAVDQAQWDIVAAHARGVTTKMMTLRTLRTLTALTTTANWPTANTGTATAVGGGKWDVSGAGDKFVQKTVQAVIEKVAKATGGVVGAKDLVLVIDPTAAHKISQSAEILQYIVNQEYAILAWQGNTVWDTYGLPPYLWGVEIVVEDAVRFSSREGKATSTTDPAYMCGTNAIFLARPGSLDSEINNAPDAPTLSTASIFMYEDMTVETFPDPENRRTTGRVTDDVAVALTAPQSGFLVTAIHS